MFLFRLARELKIGTVREMVVRMPATELDEWRDFLAAEDAVQTAIEKGIPSEQAHRMVYTDMKADDADD